MVLTLSSRSSPSNDPNETADTPRTSSQPMRIASCDFIYAFFSEIVERLCGRIGTIRVAYYEPTKPIGTITYEPGLIEYAPFPDRDSPVWILGSKFELKESADADAVRKAFTSLIWMTYRRNFAAIGGEGPTSDTGWGCMLRAGQMMFAQALIRRHLGKGWRWSPEDSIADAYARILRMFQDKKSSTFSIHQISLMGDEKAVGDWCGPNTVAQALRKLIGYDRWSNMRMHVALDNLVVLSEIETLCTSTPETWDPLVLVVPYRAGLSELNPIYKPAMANLFKMESCLGLLGGRPGHALYFVGVQEEDLVFLDPHTTHNFVDLEAVVDGVQVFDDSTYHCSRAQRLNISSIDPSMALCFYIESREHLKRWEQDCRELLVNTSDRMIFDIVEKPLEYERYPAEDLEGPSTTWSTSDEDFELL